MLSVLAIPVLDNSFLSALISSLSRSYTIHPRLAGIPCLLAINPRCSSIIFPYFASMILPSPRFVVKYSTLLHSKKSSVQRYLPEEEHCVWTQKNRLWLFYQRRFVYIDSMRLLRSGHYQANVDGVNSSVDVVIDSFHSSCIIDVEVSLFRH